MPMADIIFRAASKLACQLMHNKLLTKLAIQLYMQAAIKSVSQLASYVAS